MLTEDIIFNELAAVYGRLEYKPRGFTMAVIKGEEDLLVFTTVAVMRAITEVVLEKRTNIAEYKRRILFNSIQQAIWINYPGGTTAANAAHKVCTALDIDHDYDPRKY